MEEKDLSQNNFGSSVPPSSNQGSTYPENVSIYKWKFSPWQDLPLGCKFIFIVSVLLSLLSIFFKNYQEKLVFWGFKVIENYQFQRLFFTYLLDGWAELTAVSLVAKLFWLRFLFCQQERKLSTVHFVIDTFLQSLLLNLVLTIFSSILYNGLGVIPYNHLVLSNGFSPMIMIFIWSEVARYTNHRIDLWFLPFLIPFKVLPAILLKYRLAQGLDYFWADLFGCILGYIQFIIVKKRFTRLPFSFYLNVEKIIPDFIKNNKNFIKISTVQIDLKFQSFNRENLSDLSRVNAIGGVQIDKNEQSKDNSVDFKQRWKNYPQKKEVQSDETKRDDLLNQDNLYTTQQQLASIQNKPPAKDNFNLQNHSSIRLGDSKYNQQQDDEQIESESQDEGQNSKLVG